MGAWKALNSQQEAGSALAGELTTIRGMKEQFPCEPPAWRIIGRNPLAATVRNVNFLHRKRCDESHCLSCFDGLTITAVYEKFHLASARDCLAFSSLAFFLLAFLFPMMGSALDVETAQARVASTPRTTVVIFADHPMVQERWDALFGALRAGVVDGGSEAATLDARAEFVRGDSLVAGMPVEKAIVVFLHGDCNFASVSKKSVLGVPLGWVWRRHGLIEPFAHVNCTLIGQVLGPQALAMNPAQRKQVMAGAIARVIVHEWIHIATQASAHAEHGVRKAQFGVADLMAGGD